MRHIDIKSVLAGTALGLLLDMVSGVALTLLFGSSGLRPGISEAEMQQALAETVQATPFLVGSLVLGSLSTGVAGFVSARMARRLPYMHAAAVGIVGLVLGALLGNGSLPLWFNGFAFVSILPMALVGGHLAKQRRG